LPTKILSKLQGIKKINLKKKKISFTITPRQMALINNEGKCILEPGEFMFQWVDGRKIIKFGLFKLFIEN